MPFHIVGHLQRDGTPVGWTLFLDNGAVITIPSAELAEELVKHVQGWVEASRVPDGAVQVGGDEKT